MTYNFETGEIDLNDQDKMRLELMQKLRDENDQLNIQLGNAYDALSFAIDYLDREDVIDELKRILIE